MPLFDEDAEIHDRLPEVGTEQQADGTHVQLHEKDVRQHRGGDQVDDRAHAEGDGALLYAEERTRQLVVDSHIDAERDHQDEVLTGIRRCEDGLPEPARGQRRDQRPGQGCHLQRPERGLEHAAATLGVLVIEEEAEK